MATEVCVRRLLVLLVLCVYPTCSGDPGGVARGGGGRAEEARCSPGQADRAGGFSGYRPPLPEALSLASEREQRHDKQ